MLFAGILAGLSAFFQFQIPGIVGGVTDPREIFTLIGTSILHSPLYSFGIAALACIGGPYGEAFYITLFMHIVTLPVFWYIQHFLRKTVKNIYLFMASWFLSVYFIYSVFFAFSYTTGVMLFASASLHNVYSIYLNFLKGIQLETFVTAVITTLIAGWIKMERGYRLKLAEKEEEYRNLFFSIRDPIIVTDFDMKVRRCNPAFYKKFGYSEEEIVGQSLDFLISKENNAEFLHSGILQYYDKNGNRFYGDSGIYNLINSDEERYGTIKIIRDVSELIAMQKDLQKAKDKAEESDRLKSSFLANMSHEIRTPLNALVNAAYLIKINSESCPDITKTIQIIERSSERLIQLTENIIDISKIESGAIELNESRFNLNELMKHIFDYFQNQNQKRIDFSLKCDLPNNESFIVCDKTKLDQILTNIINNAFKFTEKGSIQMGYFFKDSHLEFYVSDTGIGIEKDKLLIIFDRFVQSDMSFSKRHEGSGLGLAIVKSFIELLGGSIEVKSEKDAGAIFTFTIPYKSSYSSPEKI